MKLIIDKDIPYIRGRIPEEIETVYVSGNEINSENVKDADALVVRTRTQCNRQLLEGSDVKLVATATIGTDHIDIPWCVSHGVEVRSSPGCNAPGVSQYVYASLFKSGFDPERDTLGIIGYGNVGSTVGAWAREMGVKTLVNDPPREESGKSDVEYTTLDNLLRKSDAVTIHVPFIKTGNYPTYHLIGEREMEAMKHGVILVNSSRGGVVDEKALKRLIEAKDIRAVVDVWENEPFIDTDLAQMAIVATPHIAGYSCEGKKRATTMVLESLRKVLGVKVDLRGLECNPPKGIAISRELITRSYNPFDDKKNLLKDISKFESLRNGYDYRHEPLFTEIGKEK